MSIGAVTWSSWTDLSVPSHRHVEERSRASLLSSVLGVPTQSVTISWQELKMRSLKALDYLPNVCWILSAGMVLVNHYVGVVPTVVRVMVAAFSTLNAFLIPTMVDLVLSKLSELVSQTRGLIGMFEGVVSVTHLSGVASLFTMLTASGLSDVSQNIGFPVQTLEGIVQAILPWVFYVLRLSTITQLMDISSGMQANARLSRLLAPETVSRRLWNLWPAPVFMGRRFHGFKFCSLEYAKSHQIVGILRKNSRFFKKVSVDSSQFDATLNKIEKRMRSWMPPVTLFGCLQAQQLARRLETRSVFHVHNQLLGLAANTAAIMGMIMAASAVASAYFGMIAASFFILQTRHVNSADLHRDR